MANGTAEQRKTKANWHTQTKEGRTHWFSFTGKQRKTKTHRYKKAKEDQGTNRHRIKSMYKQRKTSYAYWLRRTKEDKGTLEDQNKGIQIKVAT